MPRETTVTIGAKVKGFVEAGQQAAKITKAAAAAAKDQLKTTKDVEKELGRLQGRLKDVARNQISLNKEMDKVGKGTQAYKLLTNQLRDLNKQQSNLERTAKGVERAFDSQAKAAAKAAASGSLLQGVIQGVAPGSAMFLQRGPGMMRQAAGQAIGRMGRGAAGGLAAMPFQGLGGLAQTLRSLPGGGLLAQPLEQAAAASGAFMQMQQVGLQTMPFLGGTGLTRQIGEARRKAGVGFGAKDIEKTAELAGEAAEIRALARRTELRKAPRQKEREVSLAGFMAPTAREFEAMAVEFPEQVREDVTGAERERLTKEGRQRRARAGTGARRGFFQPIQRAGVELLAGGVPEARQLAAQISQVGGGTGMEMGAQGLTRAAFAAKSLYGVGPQVSGAFLQAGRRGGAVGAGGRSGEALAEAIGDATRLGLEGSELNDYLSQIASGITSWKDTGIPINAKSIGDISVSMASLGLGGLRGGRVGAGLAGAARTLSERGPQSAAELLAYQELGGYRGGGAAAFEKAQIRMEEGGFGPEQIQRLLGRYLATGGEGEEGQAIGRGTFRRALRGMGVRVGGRETMIMSKRLRGEALTEKEQERITKWEAQAEVGAKEGAAIRDPLVLARKAAKAIDMMAPNIKRQSIMANEQIEIGGRMVATMQTLEGAQQNLANTFSEVAGPFINDLAGSVQDLTITIGQAVDFIKGKIGGDTKLESGTWW